MPLSAYTGELAALATACCWTVTGLAFESAGKRIGSLAVNLIRLVLAFGFLTTFCWITLGRPLPTDADGHAWLWLSASGIVGFTIGDLCLFRAFVVIGARLSLLLMSLVPPLSALIGWALLGERLGILDLVGMGLTIGGVVWVVAERKPAGDKPPVRNAASGMALGLLAAAGQAGGLVLSKLGMREMSPFAATQIRVIAGIAGFAVLFTVIGWWPRVIQGIRNGAAMARVTLGATFGPFLGVSLSLMAVQHTETGVAATIMAIVPVLIIAPSRLLFKEPISARAVIGALVAVGGVGVLFL